MCVVRVVEGRPSHLHHRNHHPHPPSRHHFSLHRQPHRHHQLLLSLLRCHPLPLTHRRLRDTLLGLHIVRRPRLCHHLRHLLLIHRRCLLRCHHRPLPHPPLLGHRQVLLRALKFSSTSTAQLSCCTTSGEKSYSRAITVSMHPMRHVSCLQRKADARTPRPLEVGYWGAIYACACASKLVSMFYVWQAGPWLPGEVLPSPLTSLTKTTCG
mmetsp:Transcript_15169/g.37960  ORF Transcript_15169/g.37960 Transcript_15169/m.37960 type:complete len:211 (+) Transcript_15169:74-706(+)